MKFGFFDDKNREYVINTPKTPYPWINYLGSEKFFGIISHQANDIEVRCLPKDLPEYIEVDISELALNQTIHLSNLKLPQGVELVELAHGRDSPVVSIHAPRAEEPEPTAAVAAEGAAPAEGAAAAAPAAAGATPAAAPAAAADAKKEAPKKEGGKK